MAIAVKRAQVQQENGTRNVDAEEVARVAYSLYEQRGREDGHDLEDWLEAERIVRSGAARNRFLG